MLKSQTRPARGKAFTIVSLQGLAVLVVAALLWIFAGSEAAYSSLLGGLAYLLPSFYFAFQLFRDTRARMAKQVLVRFFVGETIKLVLSAVLFVLIYKYIPVAPPALIVGYVVATQSVWLTPLLFSQRKW